MWPCSPAMLSSGVGEAVAGLLVGQGHGPVAAGRVAQHRYPARPAGPRPAPRPRPLPAARPWPAARAPDRCHQAAADRVHDLLPPRLALFRPRRVGKTTVPTMVAASLAGCWMTNSPPKERTRRLRTWRGRRRRRGRRWRPARPSRAWSTVQAANSIASSASASAPSAWRAASLASRWSARLSIFASKSSNLAAASVFIWAHLLRALPAASPTCCRASLAARSRPPWPGRYAGAAAHGTPTQPPGPSPWHRRHVAGDRRASWRNPWGPLR